MSASHAERSGDEDWLAEFHSGERPVLERCYREHFQTVSSAVGRVLQGADRETVIHEVFLRLMTDEALRRNFSGGSLRAWLTKVARNHARDYQRHRNREQPLDQTFERVACQDCFSEAAEARLVIEGFRRDVLDAKWVGVFEMRFLAQLDQRQAARLLGISRTTLAYQEHRVRALLKRYLRGAVAESPSIETRAPSHGA
jgi:RNA polymerase sigma-70 factor (ECF subfamily)